MSYESAGWQDPSFESSLYGQPVPLPPELASLLLSAMSGILYGRMPDAYDVIDHKDIYEATKALGDYCVGQEISQVVLMDRSARPVWVGLYEYLDLAYPEAQKPSIHFFNPQALEANTRSPLFAPVKEHIARNKAAKELEHTHNSLLDHKDEPTLLFDACIHTGETLENAQRLLERSGLTDVRVGVFTAKTSSDCQVALDFCFTRNWRRLACRPYGRDAGITKSGESIYSDPPMPFDPRANAYYRDIAGRRVTYRQLIAEEHENWKQRQPRGQ